MIQKWEARVLRNDVGTCQFHPGITRLDLAQQITGTATYIEQRVRICVQQAQDVVDTSSIQIGQAIAGNRIQAGIKLLILIVAEVIDAALEVHRLRNVLASIRKVEERIHEVSVVTDNRRQALIH